MKHAKLHVPVPKACLASKEPNKETAVAVPEHGIFNSWLEDEVGMCENPMDAPIWQDLPQRPDRTPAQVEPPPLPWEQDSEDSADNATSQASPSKQDPHETW